MARADAEAAVGQALPGTTEQIPLGKEAWGQTWVRPGGVDQ